MVSLPCILNRWILPTILDNFIGTYDLVIDIKSITFVTLENKQPLNRPDFLILLMTRYIIPNSVISNNPTIYQFL